MWLSKISGFVLFSRFFVCVNTALEVYFCIVSWITPYTGADPENVEPGGANSINYQTEPEGGANLFFGLIYKDEQGGRAPGAPPSKSAPVIA